MRLADAYSDAYSDAGCVRYAYAQWHLPAGNLYDIDWHRHNNPGRNRYRQPLR